MKRSLFLFEYTENGEEKTMVYTRRDDMHEMAMVMRVPNDICTKARVTEFQQIHTEKLK